MTPNIFRFATSELSQDAFICWLVQWADTKYETVDSSLFQVGRKFIESLYEKAGRVSPQYKAVNIKRQEGKIDVFIELSDSDKTKTHYILIEDKIYTSNHSNQLSKYRDFAVNNLKCELDKTLLIYFKTWFQLDYDNLDEFTPYIVPNFLKVLEFAVSIGVENNILTDFYDVLAERHNSTTTFENKPFTHWCKEEWIGFFMKVQSIYQGCKWSWVDNPRGGFLALWYGWTGKSDEYELYAQFEVKNKQLLICFKIYDKHSTNLSTLRNCCFSRLLEVSSNSNLKIKRPTRFGKGKTMTFGIYDGKVIEQDDDFKINFDKLKNLMDETKVLLEKI